MCEHIKIIPLGDATAEEAIRSAAFYDLDIYLHQGSGKYCLSNRQPSPAWERFTAPARGAKCAA